MDKKLTLSLNETVINKAKSYAADKKMSLSRIVEPYLQSLVSEEDSAKFGISPFVKSMSSGTKIPLDLDYKKEYSDYLVQKHK